MKKLLLLFVLCATLVSASGQSVKAKLGDGGNFLILNSGTPGDPIDPEFVKLLISELGAVNWYLDGQDMFIRDGAFEAFPVDTPGVTYKYNFLKIDGANGRIGFNTIEGRSTVGGPLLSGPNEALTSSVTLFGSVAYRVRIIPITGTNYEMKQDDHVVIFDKTDNTTSQIELSDVASSKGRLYYMKRNENAQGAIDIRPLPGQKLNGVVDEEITLNVDNSSLQLVCDGESWWVLSEISATKTTSLKTIIASAALTTEEFIAVNFTSNNQIIDVSLPSAADYTGKRYEVKRNANGATFSGNVLRIVPQLVGAEKLDQYTNANPFLMTNDFESVTIASNGTQWLIANNYKADEALVTVAGNYTPAKNDKTILVNGQFTVTLPDATTLPVGKTYTVKRINSGGSAAAPTVAATGGQTFDGLTNVLLNQRADYVTVQNDGSNWQVISERISASFVSNPTLPYTASVYDGTISANAAGTINLPSAASVLGGKVFTIKNAATAGNPTLTVDPSGAETIDGLATWPLAKDEFLTIQSDGANWILIGQ